MTANEIPARADATIVIAAESRPTDEVVFLPTDVSGGTGPLNSGALESLGLTTSIIPDAKDLSRGYAIVPDGDVLLCFVGTVGTLPTQQLLDENLRTSLSEKRLYMAKSA